MPHRNNTAISAERDDVSLIDLWLTLKRHRALFWSVVSVSILCGILVAAFTAAQYRVATVIEIGYLLEDGEITPIQPPETVKAKLETVLEPSLRLESNLVSILSEPRITIPENSLLISIAHTVKEAQVSDVEKFQRSLASKLIDEHAQAFELHRAKFNTEVQKSAEELKHLRDGRFLEPTKTKLQAQIRETRAQLTLLTDPAMRSSRDQTLQNRLTDERQRLASLRDRETHLRNRHSNLEKAGRLLQRQIEALQTQIGPVAAEQGQTADGFREEEIPKNASSQISNSETQQNRLRLAELEQRLVVGIENAKSSLLQDISDIRRAQIQQTNLIEQLESSQETAKIELQLQIDRLNSAITQSEAKLREIDAQHERQVAMKELELAGLKTEGAGTVNTRIATGPMRSAYPIGTTPYSILAIALLLGLLVGTAAVFLRAFIDNAKTQAQSVASLQETTG